MSFLGGAECSTAGNPLTQFSKQLQNDNSLQRDRLVGRGVGGSEQGFRSVMSPNGSDQMMNDFMQQPAHLQPQPFAMEQLRRDLPAIRQVPQRADSPGWAGEFDAAEQARMEAAFQGSKMGGVRSGGLSPAEFTRFQHTKQPGLQRTSSPITQTQQPMSGFQRPLGLGYSGMAPGMMMRPTYSPMSTQQPQDLASDKGKNRMVELDDTHWEAQFAEMETVDQTSLSGDANAAIEAELDELDRSVSPKIASETIHGDFESIWRGIQAERSDRQLGDTEHITNWNEEFDDFSNYNDLGLNTHDLGSDMPAYGEPEEYYFDGDNAFLLFPDPFSEGIHILETNGNLTLASLAFEAAVQHKSDHIQAWLYLGNTQAQNEKETPAIRALEEALRLDPNNLDALMSLSVSYVNEGYESTAYRTLERWLSVKYPQIISPSAVSQPAELGFTDRHMLHKRITDLFIQAAQLSPSGASMDPDVQVGLGVLFYGDEEFDKAVDCFSAALASTEEGTSNSKGQVHLLWNRLGATLANSGRSEDAIAAYEKALTLNPNFVRARYNLGVSCINIGCYPEAAQHLLGALSLHRVFEDKGREHVQQIVGDRLHEVNMNPTIDKMLEQNESTNLHETLRRALASMGRRDLSEKVGPDMNLNSFRSEFDF